MARTPVSSPWDAGLIPGQGSKIPHAMWCSQKKEKKQKQLKNKRNRKVSSSLGKAKESTFKTNTAALRESQFQ